jgi:hypothetical protein
VIRYKVRLDAQGFMQRTDNDFNETYSSVMNPITYTYLILLIIQNHLSLQFMDVMIAYLYGSLDLDNDMKVSGGISIPSSHAGNMYCVKLTKSLYGLKQSVRMWYNQL